ncbi:MAG: GIY-YIG nuclease family protein [Patescibacteria group bacterium]
MMPLFYSKFPDSPGVYLMKDVTGRILYIGKAANLKRRVSSYFLRPHGSRIQKLVSEIKKIDYRSTDTAIEALILEAQLIKKYLPPYNIREKDDKSFLYVEITKEKFPRVLLVRGKERLAQPHFSLKSAAGFGPFTSASSIREALRIIRRIFPFSVHSPDAKFTRPCFEREIGLCPGTCVGAINRVDYLKNIRNLKLFFQGKKDRIVTSLTKEMRIASKKLEFEKAEKWKRQIFALRHIQDVALITEERIASSALQAIRIEGYDISNISGTSAVGSMVVFAGNEPERNQYRKFKIKLFTEPNDVGMLSEVLRRRFHNAWPLPVLILVDGGKGQVHAAKDVIREFGLRIPVVGIAKGPERKRNDVVGIIPKGIAKSTLINVRDEAHRFAIAYHKTLRSQAFLR